MSAFQDGYTDIAKVLLNLATTSTTNKATTTTSGIDVNTRTPGTFTILMRAAWNNRLEVVELLIKHGADVNLRDTDVRVIIMTHCNDVLIYMHIINIPYVMYIIFIVYIFLYTLYMCII